MKLNFENNLKKYTAAIHQSLADLTKEGRKISDEKRNQLTRETAQASATDVDAELLIYKLQKNKLEKLNKFKDFLERTRGVEGTFVHPEIKSNAPVVSSDGQGGFSVRSLDGQVLPITLAEIMTDGEWDVEYSFDTSVNIHDLRKYYLEQLKGELREKLDQQIIASETANTRTDTFKQNAYRAIGERIEWGSEQGGVIAEKMVKNFLKKLAIDTDADFEVVDADVHQDVEQKIDFIIHRKNNEKNRGARIEESDMVQEIVFKDIGIQFTMNTEKTEYKERQIHKAKKNLGNDIDDIVLVTLPVEQVSSLYKQWSHKKRPGGPEKSWTPETQEKIFRGVMNKVLSPEEIEEFCTKNFK